MKINNEKSFVPNINKQRLKLKDIYLLSENLLPRDYQIEIFNQAKDDNSIIYMETGRGKTLISIMLINYHYMQTREEPNSDQNFRVFFLVNEVSLVMQQEKAISSNLVKGLLTKSVYGGKKELKKTEKAIEFLSSNNTIFICIGDIFYKLLSRGYIKMKDISLIIFDECHHSTKNHSYKTILDEFYYYYKARTMSQYRLPIIYGLTASPLKTKINKSFEIEATQSLVELSESLDCKFVCDPDFLHFQLGNSNKSLDLSISDFNSIRLAISKETEDEFIEFNNITDDYLYLKEVEDLKKGVFFPILMTLEEILKENDVMNTNKYKNFIDTKFNSKDYFQYTYTLNDQAYIELYRLSINNPLMLLFEKLQNQIYLILESISHCQVYNHLEKYVLHFKLLVTSHPEYSSTLNKWVQIIKTYLLNKQTIIDSYQKVDLESDKLKKLKKKLYEIFEDNPYSKVMIFIPNRILSEYLSNILNSYFFSKSNIRCVNVVGVNKSSSDLAMTFSNSLEKLNASVEEFRDNKANVLIGTSTIEEGIDISQCNYVISLSMIRTPKTYIQMRGRARKDNSKFFIFTSNKHNSLLSIELFINFHFFLKNLFKDSIIKDFRRKDYIDRQVDIKREYYQIPLTEGKLSIRNVNHFFNELIQEMTFYKKQGGIEILNEQYKVIKKASGSNSTNYLKCELKWDYQDMDLHDCFKIVCSENIYSKGKKQSVALYFKS